MEKLRRAYSIRGLELGVIERLRVGARARGITQGEYVARLVKLHQEALERGESYGNGAMLRECGLEPVRA